VSRYKTGRTTRRHSNYTNNWPSKIRNNTAHRKHQGKITQSVHCAITGPCLRMRHRPLARRLYQIGRFTGTNYCTKRFTLIAPSEVVLVNQVLVSRHNIFLSILVLVLISSCSQLFPNSRRARLPYRTATK